MSKSRNRNFFGVGTGACRYEIDMRSDDRSLVLSEDIAKLALM